VRLTSFRTRVLLLAVAFSIFLIGTVMITTYFVVAGTMTRAAEDSAVRLSHQATKLARDRVADLQRTTESSGAAVPAGAEDAARRGLHGAFISSLPELFSSGLPEGEFAFFELTPSGSLEAAISSGERPLDPSEDADRLRAVRTSSSTLSIHGSVLNLAGLFGKAELGTYTVHVPIDMPGGGTGVLDVVYVPNREEQTVASIHMPMIVLAIVGTSLAVGMMQMSMGWVLRLVNELRLAADSIDAGQLDVRLPESGQDEIGDLARSLNSLIERLRRRSESQTRFIADASHELATPVAGIRGYINILRAWGAEDEAVRDEAVRAIDRESRRMVRLCSELLSMIRSERDTACRAVRVDVNSLCREALAGAATRYLDKGLEFVGPDEGQLYVDGDPDRIEESLSILVDNAAKYTPPGGLVRTSTWRRKDVIAIEVSDTGVGIPEKDLTSIFDRFYRSDISRSKETGGFGLGLAIAKRMIETCGGTIEVRSVVGEGTTFTVRLPRQQR
jgi:signal transduction histidine kinase